MIELDKVNSVSQFVGSTQYHVLKRNKTSLYNSNVMWFSTYDKHIFSLLSVFPPSSVEHILTRRTGRGA